MTRTTEAVAQSVQAQFDGPWRDDVPVFGCCRKSVATAIDKLDLLDVASRDVTARVQAIREAVEHDVPGHLSTHRCCSGHLANLAFDLPDLLTPADSA